MATTPEQRLIADLERTAPLWAEDGAAAERVRSTFLPSLCGRHSVGANTMTAGCRLEVDRILAELFGWDG